MKRFVLMAAVAAVALLADGQWASARRGCGGGRHGGRHGGCGGCGGMMMGGCGMGGCGMMMGGCGMGGYGMMRGGYGGHVMAGYGISLTTQATLIVNLPEDATLTIDGEDTTSTSAQRVFVTPALEEGKEYEYTLKAKVERDGKVRIATAKVTVRPGQVSQVEIKVPAAGVAAQ